MKRIVQICLIMTGIFWGVFNVYGSSTYQILKDQQIEFTDILVEGDSLVLVRNEKNGFSSEGIYLGVYNCVERMWTVEYQAYDEYLGDFSYDDETYAMKDDAIFIVDIYGNERFLTNADECWQMDSNLYAVGINENWNVINSNGEYLFSETHDNHEVNEKYIAGNNEEKKHGMLILKSGEVVNTEYQKYMLSYTVPDIVKVYDGANYGMLGSNGELIVPCSYDSCEISEDGAYITADRQRDEYGNYTECTLFDSNGNKIETFDTGIYNVGVFRKISNAA